MSLACHPPSLAQCLRALGRLPLLGRAHRTPHTFPDPGPNSDRRVRRPKRQHDGHGTTPIRLHRVRKSALVDGPRLDRRAAPWEAAFMVQRLAGASSAPCRFRAACADDGFLVRRWCA